MRASRTTDPMEVYACASNKSMERPTYYDDQTHRGVSMRGSFPAKRVKGDITNVAVSGGKLKRLLQAEEGSYSTGGVEMRELWMEKNERCGKTAHAVKSPTSGRCVSGKWRFRRSPSGNVRGACRAKRKRRINKRTRR